MRTIRNSITAPTRRTFVVPAGPPSDWPNWQSTVFDGGGFCDTMLCGSKEYVSESITRLRAEFPHELYRLHITVGYQGHAAVLTRLVEPMAKPEAET